MRVPLVAVGIFGALIAVIVVAIAYGLEPASAAAGGAALCFVGACTWAGQ